MVDYICGHGPFQRSDRLTGVCPCECGGHGCQSPTSFHRSHLRLCPLSGAAGQELQRRQKSFWPGYNSFHGVTAVSGGKSGEITQLLKAWEGGDRGAPEPLAPLVYQELHSMARGYLYRESPGNTLQATALVNEAYLRLAGAGEMNWQDGAHFFAISPQMMRRILVDAAHARRSEKRGRPAAHPNLEQVFPDLAFSRGNDLIGLDDALSELAKIDPRKVRVIELRFFGGLSVEETASVLDISAQSVMRDWKLGKAWLKKELSSRSTP
jgi:RNA polymerase sigma-70 factor, ECF subfamily